MILDRSSGILLHPTSLPGPFGIGDIGPGAVRWLEWVAAAGCRYWQTLPLGTTGYADSPYQSFSANAGNPNLISPELLVEDGLVTSDQLEDHPDFDDASVDFGSVIPWKTALLDEAYDRFRDSRMPRLRRAHDDFVGRSRAWLDDYSLFMAVKEAHGSGPWWEWPKELRLGDQAALERSREVLAESVDRHTFRQFLFFRQWNMLRGRARELDVEIIGDIPIFVAMDSVDVWSRPELFHLDDNRRPVVVAGVPPDLFSETGQLWGNPLYDWAVHSAEGYAWWIDRLQSMRDLVDVIRIDHFRGFVDYWEIPAGSPTAETGRWVDGPGRSFFDAVADALEDLPIIAEDLGELHEAVPALRDELGLPGMKILQFAYDGDPANDFLPERYPENCVAYTGTHDNQTVLGWYRSASREQRRQARRHLRTRGSRISRAMVEAVWESRANLAMAPLQDILGLDDAARMNTPATVDGNWRWRCPDGLVTDDLATWLRNLNRSSGRS
jgi:4-alpha-glucanotransferase